MLELGELFFSFFRKSNLYSDPAPDYNDIEKSLDVTGVITNHYNDLPTYEESIKKNQQQWKKSTNFDEKMCLIFAPNIMLLRHITYTLKIYVYQ